MNIGMNKDLHRGHAVFIFILFIVLHSRIADNINSWRIIRLFNVPLKLIEIPFSWNMMPFAPLLFGMSLNESIFESERN